MEKKLKSRFVATRGRRDNTTRFNMFWITDKKGEIPDMHFLYEKDMWYVYDLLDKGLMVFDCS